MLAHTMFYTDEVRFENEFRTDVQPVGAKELQLARTFLEALEAPFSPEEFKDAYRQELQAMIEEAGAGGGCASKPELRCGDSGGGYPGETPNQLPGTS